MPSPATPSSVGAIILAQDNPLVWADLHGQPVLARTVNVFEASAQVTAIIIVVDAAHLLPVYRLACQFAWNKLCAVCIGRSLRSSLRHALAALPPQAATVIVHDGARPLVTETLIAAGLQAVTSTGAATASVPLKETVKRADTQDVVIATPDRSRLRLVQTPQVFQRDLLQNAFQVSEPASAVADAAQVVQRAGGTITLFAGEYTNLRLATATDLALAQAIWAAECR